MRFLNKNFFGKCFIKNKKGISPLIATVLLIGFTVALAAVVITWGSGFVQRVTEGTDIRTAQALACTGDLNFEITKVVCDNNGAVLGGASTVTLDNKGNIDIKGIILRFFDSTGTNTASTQFDTGIGLQTVGKYEIKTLTLFPGTVPQLLIPVSSNKVEVLATVVLNGQNVTCSDAPKTKAFTACV